MGDSAFKKLPSDRQRSAIRERRRAARKTITQLVPLQPATPGGAFVVNVSAGGLGVCSADPQEFSSLTRVDLDLPNSRKRIQAKCEMAWSNEASAGLRFTEIAPAALSELAHWAELPLTQSASPEPPAVVPSFAVPEESHWLSDSIRQMGWEVKAGQSSPESALEWIAKQIRMLADADGAAIAYVESGQQMVCRASVGAAPDVGARLSAGSGLSGLCMATQATVLAADTATDPRVDSVAAQALAARSVLVVPFFEDGKLRGLVEVLARAPNRFAERQQAELESIAPALPELLSPRPYGAPPPPPPRAAAAAPRAPVQINQVRRAVREETAPQDPVDSVREALRSAGDDESSRHQPRKLPLLLLLLILLAAVAVAAWYWDQIPALLASSNSTDSAPAFRSPEM